MDVVLSPRDVLFFRDACPMDTPKTLKVNLNLIGHGANWPRPDQLFSAVMHTLIRDPNAPEKEWYGTMKDLRVMGSFPQKDEMVYLPFPLDWRMAIKSLPEGKTNLPKPLTHGFLDKDIGKKSYPAWVPLDDYACYLDGQETQSPKQTTLYFTDPRIGTTLDVATGASKRTQSEISGQWHAEYLRLEEGVSMVCEIAGTGVDRLINTSMLMGGQGGTVQVKASSLSLREKLMALPKGHRSRFVRWTLIAPALYMKGWYPNWLDDNGRVMIPQNEVLRKAGETRAAWRARKQTESRYFETAHLVAARIGAPIHFSGWDNETGEKPTELAVPPGSAYIFECTDETEADALIRALHLKSLSDLGEKGFGIGLCSYVHL